MHLMSLEPQTVTVGGEAIPFAKGETIHTECSYKYTMDGIRSLAESSGWRVAKTLCDEHNLFSLHYFEAA
jgi:uncharacterized SAM-dependent methyltransferase